MLVILLNWNQEGSKGSSTVRVKNLVTPNRAKISMSCSLRGVDIPANRYGSGMLKNRGKEAVSSRYRT